MKISNFIYRYRFIMIILVLIPIVVIIVFLIAKYDFNKALYSNEFTEIICSLLSYIGTLLLGILALWQNDKVHDINNRLINFEESKSLPYIAINDKLVSIEDYKTPNPRDFYNSLTCTYDNPNTTFTFSIKNITNSFISRIYIEIIDISTRKIEKDGFQDNFTFLNQNENILLNSFIEPNIEKKIHLSLNVDKSLSTDNYLCIMIVLKMVYLNNKLPNKQHLNFIALRDLDDNNFYIVTKEILNDKTINQIFSSKA